MIEAAYHNLVENHLITESHHEYNSKRDEYTTSTVIKTIVKESPADLKEAEDNPDDEVKPSYILGNAVHCLSLEGATQFGKTFKIGGPTNDAGDELGVKSDAFRDARIIQNANGIELIPREMYDTSKLMRDSLFRHKYIKTMIGRKAEGVSEKVIRTEFMGMKCQVRFDRLSPLWGIPDLKTCRDIFLFKREARYKFKYLVQAAFYQLIAYHVAPQFGYMPFIFIVVESKAPYKCGYYQVPEEDMEHERNKVMDAMIYLKECRETGVYPTGFEEVQTI